MKSSTNRAFMAKKQSTFSAQVANKLFSTIASLRLLLVMFVALTVSTNAWAQTKTDIMFAKGFGNYTTNIFSAAGSDRTAVANSTNATSVKYAMQVFNGSTGAVRGNQSSAASNFSCRNTTTYDGYYISQVSLTVSGGTIDGSTNNRSVVYFGSTAYGNPNTTAPSGTATKASPTSSGQATLTWTNTNEDVSYFILYNLKTSGTALSAAATTSLKVVWTKKTAAAPSHTITATSNNNSYGTVSVSGTTITATPNDGYRVKSGDAGYTVTSGTAVVTNNGNNTFSVTPSSNCTITINFEAIPTYTINWHTAVGTVEDEVLEEGATITKPATDPTMTGYEFMGWTEDCEVASDGAGFTPITNFGTATEDKDYYAVFAEATTTGGGGGSTDVTIDLTSDAQVTTNSAEDLVFTEGDVTFTNTKVSGQTNANNYCPSTRTSTRTYNGHKVTIAAGSTISKIVITAASTSYATAIQNATWTNGSATASSSTVTVTPSSGVSTVSFAPSATAGMTEVVVTTGGGGSTTYDNYRTACTAETSYSVTSTLSHVTADAENATTINPEDEELLLSYSAESGWNLPATISVTMGGAPLSSETDYDWDNGDLLIAPASGFTGDIVVTINGWQQLAAPTGLNVSNITSSGATLSWNTVTNASSYTVQFYGENDEIIAEYTDLTQTTKEVSGLESYTYYIWAVTAIGDGTTYTNSEESETAEFTTLNACEKLGAATGLAVVTNFVQDGQTYVKFSWTPAAPSKEGTTQELCYGLVGQEKTCTVSAKHLGEAKGVASNLPAGEYEWSIQALGDGVNYCDGDVVDGTNFYIYSITYNTNGGNTIPATSGTTLPAELPAPTKTGYTFAGWYTDSEFNTPATAGAAITQNTTLYAKWTAKTYTVTLDNQGATTAGAASVTATYNAAMPSIASNLPERTGYTFGGYFTEQNGEGTQYYNQSGGAYNNKKWDQATDATLYAKWTANKYTVKFNGNDNTGGSMSDQSFTYDTPQNLTTNAFTRIGYTFNGWNTNASGSGTSYTDGQEVINLNSTSGGQITLYAQWEALPTYTVSWIVNGNKTATESVVVGNQITQYPSDPSAPSGCREKVFVGWTDNPINTPTDEAPAILYKQKSDVPAITGNTTLHAVFATAIGGGSGNYELVESEPSDWSGTYLIVDGESKKCFDGSLTTLDANGNYESVTINDKTITSNTTTDSYSVTISKSTTNGKYYIKTASGYYIGSDANSTGSNELDASNSIKYNNGISLSQSNVTIQGTDHVLKYSYDASSSRFRYYKSSSQNVRLPQLYKKSGGTTYSAYTTLCDECTLSESLVLSANASTADLDIDGEATITFSTTGGNGGEITYVANPNTGVTWDNGTATFTEAGEYSITASQGKNDEKCPTTSNTVNVTITAIPHLYFVTEPADPIEFEAVECGGNTALTNKKSVELQGYNLTGNVTVNVTGAYKIARTSSATLGEYSNSLTLDKTDAGKINGNYDIVYILSCPPAGGTASTEGTLTFTTQGGEQLTVNLFTQTVTCTPRTLTFNDRGNTTTQEYYAGAEVPQPEDPTGVCTIPVNYVFDGWAEAEVTDGSTSYTKVNFPYSMPAANTTLYAVYRYTEENANSDKFMSVDKELGELVSGMDYVLTGYYDSKVHYGDDNEYAMSITAYETGKYKTKYVDVQESSILYEEDIPYYEFTTTDNEIIWTIEGDEANGYTFQNKSNNKYLAVSADKLTLSDNAAKFTIEHETGVENDEEVYYMSLLIQPVGSTNYLSSYYKNATAGVLFNLHTASTLSLYLYKRVASNLYTTSPDCGGIAITYDFAGGDGGHCTDTRVEGGSDYTICEDVPTKTGYTFLHWSDGANTYNPSDVIVNVTADVTLTAIWQINTYTVTWSNNGASTPVEYNHGDALEVPAAPASCDGVKEFVGWTEQSGYYHATTPPSDLFTEKTATVTADATYYAVFATQGEGSANFVLGESGTFKMYANVNGTNYYAQGGVSSKKITSTTEAANASDYTLTHKGSNQYTIQLGNAYIGHSGTSSTDLNTTETTWTIQEGVNGSWRIVSPVNTSRALAYRASTYKIFKAYSMTSVEAGDTEYYDIEFGGTSSGYSDYTTTCQQIESIEVQSPQTEFYLTDDFTIGTGKVIATLSGSGTTDVTALATFSGYNMNQVGTYTVTVTYMGATATYEINVKPLDNAWVLTWNVSGKTNTGLSPRSVTKGNAIGTLPVPEVPAACEGKTFMGWTESNIVPSDGKGIVYITEETKPTDNTTYYAVFATVNNFSVQKPIEEIKSGSKVVVVAVASLTADGGSGKAISSRTISITSQGVIGLSGDEVSISDETINTPHSTCIWTLTKEGGGIVLEQDGNYIRAVDDGYRKLLLETTKDYWTLTPVEGKYQTYHMQSGNTEHYLEWFDHTDDKYDEGEKYIGFVPFIQANDYGDFDMQFFVTLGDNADITDYTTGCEEYTITYYGFRGGYSTSTSSDGIIVLPVNSLHTVPDCGDVVTDHTNLGREFLNVWMTQPHGGHTFKPGDTFILTQDTTLYAQWKLETTSDVTTLPTDIEDMAGTDIYVYGGKTLNIQPGSTTINSLTLKGGLQSDGSYKMPIVWVPEGATLVRNSNKIYLDLVVNAKNYYPFAVPFATKNDQYIDYLDPVLNAASTYDKHFVIKTYDGARRADVGEDRANNWVKVLRHQSAENPSYLQPGVGYIIQALTYPDKDTATIRIPMTVPNTWFENGEQAVVGTTVRNTIAVTAHDGAAANEHLRHAGWNFVASPYLTNFAGGNVENNGGLEYINGELTVNGGWVYGGDEVPYVTIPAYDFSYYTQHKLSDVKLSPEWSFFVQVGTGGTMNFSTDGRQEIPASIAARHDAAQSFKMDVDITLSDKHHSDQMGLIICDRFTSAYEIGYDLEKMFGSAYNLTVYTLMEDNTPLAYQALAIHSNMQVIPVGYRVPEQGEYTFRLNEATSSIDLLNEQYEQLILVDYETGALTNLLNSSYTFTSPRTQSNSRFAIYAVMRQDIPTDLPNIDDGDTSTRKILHNGHLYILRDGKVYNGHGQIVKQ